jgi:hypothetical protein
MKEEEIRNAEFPMKRQTWLLQTMILEPHRISRRTRGLESETSEGK